jgi:hypothetical protein
MSINNVVLYDKDVRFEIFKFIQNNQKGSIASVCKKWFEYLLQDYMTKTLGPLRPFMSCVATVAKGSQIHWKVERCCKQIQTSNSVDKIVDAEFALQNSLTPLLRNLDQTKLKALLKAVKGKPGLSDFEDAVSNALKSKGFKNRKPVTEPEVKLEVYDE